MVEPLATSNPNRIVVGVDGSEPSLRALAWARFIADGAGLRIEAVGVWEPLTSWAPAGMPVPVDVDMGPVTETMLKEAAAAAFGDDLPANVSLTTYMGAAADVLVRLSESATMLVVGSRGRGAVAGLFLGSVSKTCVERATCPVLVVRDQTPPPPRS